LPTVETRRAYKATRNVVRENTEKYQERTATVRDGGIQTVQDMQ